MPRQANNDDDDSSINNAVQQHLIGLPDDLEFCQPVLPPIVNHEGDDDDDGDEDGNQQQPPKKKLKVTCNIANCNNTAQDGGNCIKHGGKYKTRRYYCSIEGCNKYPKRGGVCKSHGAKVPRPLCSIEGCTNLETNKGVCIRHGARVKLCSVEECTKQAMKGGVCWSHGAKFTKVKKKCSVEDCETVASRGGMCVKHSKKECKIEGCKNQAKSGGVCYAHGAPPKKVKGCSIAGCPYQAKIRGYCKRHNRIVSTTRKESTAVVEAPPGKLGLTLQIDHVLGGATITAIDSDCKLKGQIEVGDRVTSIDDHVITQTADFGINSDKIRQFKIEIKNNLEAVLLREQAELGEKLKANLSGRQIGEMQAEIQKLRKDQEESMTREAKLRIEVDKGLVRETAYQTQLKNAKSRIRELKDETTALKRSLATVQRKMKKCPTCVEKYNLDVEKVEEDEGVEENLV